MPEWHGAADWEVGQLVTAADMNAQVRDNVGYLFARPLAAFVADEATDYTTSSTVFVDIDAADFALALEIKGTRVKAHFHGNVFLDATLAGTQRAFFDIAVDGVRVAGDDGIAYLKATNSDDRLMSFTRVIAGLTPGLHTFKLQWKAYASAGTPTLTLYAGAGTAQADVHPQFWVEEF